MARPGGSAGAAARWACDPLYPLYETQKARYESAVRLALNGNGERHMLRQMLLSSTDLIRPHMLLAWREIRKQMRKG